MSNNFNIWLIIF